MKFIMNNKLFLFIIGLILLIGLLNVYIRQINHVYESHEGMQDGLTGKYGANVQSKHHTYDTHTNGIVSTNWWYSPFIYKYDSPQQYGWITIPTRYDWYMYDYTYI